MTRSMYDCLFCKKGIDVEELVVVGCKALHQACYAAMILVSESWAKIDS